MVLPSVELKASIIASSNVMGFPVFQIHEIQEQSELC